MRIMKGSTCYNDGDSNTNRSNTIRFCLRSLLLYIWYVSFIYTQTVGAKKATRGGREFLLLW